MQARLKVIQDNANLKQVKLLPITMIGRSADCHLKIASSEVSRNHCRITVTHNEVFIEDLNSSNGTFVNQERIPPSQQILLSPGAKLHIGPASFIVDYTPPVTLETMPTTVIKSSELPFLQELVKPVPPPPVLMVIPAPVAPVAEAVPAVPTPPIAKKTVVEVPVASPPDESVPAATANQPASEPELDPFQIEPVPITIPEEEVSVAAMPAAKVAESNPPADNVYPAAPEPAPPAVTVQPPPAKPAVAVAIPVAAEAKTVPPLAAPVFASPPRATPIAKPVAKPSTVAAAPVPVAPIAPPVIAAAETVTLSGAGQETVVTSPPGSTPPVPPSSTFDFLGDSSAATAPAMEAFNFGSTAPALPVATPSTPTAAKPAAAKKSLFGLFGKKEKPANPAAPMPTPAAVPAAPPLDILAAPVAAENAFDFFGQPAPAPAALTTAPVVPAELVAVSVPEPAAPVAVVVPPPEPVAVPEPPAAPPPAAADDPFAFLKG